MDCGAWLIKKLLKEANLAMPGLQNISFSLIMSFNVEPWEFIQILHDGSSH